MACDAVGATANQSPGYVSVIMTARAFLFSIIIGDKSRELKRETIFARDLRDQPWIALRSELNCEAEVLFSPRRFRRIPPGVKTMKCPLPSLDLS